MPQIDNSDKLKWEKVVEYNELVLRSDHKSVIDKYEKTPIKSTHQFDIIAKLLYLVALAHSEKLEKYNEIAAACIKYDLEKYFCSKIGRAHV